MRTMLKDKHGMKEPEMLREMHKVFLAVDEAVADRIESLAGEGLQNETVKKVGRGFFKLNLLTDWTRFVQLTSFNIGKDLIRTNLKHINKAVKGGKALDKMSRGKLGRYKEELFELGIDIEKGLKWTNTGSKIDDPFYDETTYNAVAINNSGEVYGRYTGSAIDQFNTSVSTADNDILGFALDMDNKALYIHKNGTYMNSGSPTSGSSRTGCLIDELTASRDLYIPDNEFIFPFMHDPSTSGQLDIEFNFGGCPAFSISSGNADGNGYGNFEYAVPSSYFSLNTKNLAEYGG